MRTMLRVAGAIVLTTTAFLVAVSPATAAGSYKVTADSSRTTLEPGQSTKISGKVTGGPVKGKKVTLYWTSAVRDDPWKKIGTATLSSSGKYSKTFTPKEAGPTIVRVIKGAGSGKSAGKGFTAAFDVYKWQPLSAYKDGNAFYGSQQVNGKTYNPSLILNTNPAPTFSTSGAGCKSLRLSVGFNGAGGQQPTSSTAKFAPVNGFLNILFILELPKDHDPVDVGFKLIPTEDVQLTAQFPVANSANAVVVPKAEVLCNAPL